MDAILLIDKKFGGETDSTGIVKRGLHAEFHALVKQVGLNTNANNQLALAA